MTAPTESADLSQHVIEAWMTAARVLGIQVVAPYTLKAGEHTVECVVWLPHFGSPHGIAIGLLLPTESGTDPEMSACADAAGMYWSFISPADYAEFEAEFFKDTLRDWGYYGPSAQRPAWMGEASLPPSECPPEASAQPGTPKNPKL